MAKDAVAHGIAPPSTSPESPFMLCPPMSAHPASPTQPSAPADGGGDRALAMVERQLEILSELAEDGLQWSKAIQRQGIRQAETAALDEPARPHADLTRAYVRVTRAARLALMLQAQLIQDLKRLDSAPP